MNFLRYDIKSIRFRGKEKDRGLVIRAFQFRGDIARDKSYCYSISDNGFCTKLSHSKNGVQYIPVSIMEVESVYFLFLDDVMYRMVCKRIEAGYIDFSVEVSSTKQMSTESRIGGRNASEVDLEQIVRDYFNNVRDETIFKKYIQKINNKIVFKSEYIQHYSFIKKLRSAGFRYNKDFRSWILN